MDKAIFISHAFENDGIVKKLREKLELEGSLTWVDSRELSGGDELDASIETSIRGARHVLVVVSIAALGSEWVQREVQIALDEKTRRDDGYKVISVVLPDVKPGHLKLLFPIEPLHIVIDDTPSGFDDIMPKIFAALGAQLPRDWEASRAIRAQAIEELILKLCDPSIHEQDDVRRAQAAAGVFRCKSTSIRPKARAKSTC